MKDVVGEMRLFCVTDRGERSEVLASEGMPYLTAEGDWHVPFRLVLSTNDWPTSMESTRPKLSAWRRLCCAIWWREFANLAARSSAPRKRSRLT